MCVVESDSVSVPLVDRVPADSVLDVETDAERVILRDAETLNEPDAERDIVLDSVSVTEPVLETDCVVEREADVEILWDADDVALWVGPETVAV